MTDYATLLRALAEAGVEFIVVGGAAATTHGAARLTLDLDVVYRRTPDNLVRVVRCMDGLAPYLRGAPAGLPFRWDLETLRHGLNFTLDTSAGAIDFLGEIVGGGTYDSLHPDSIVVHVFGIECLCLGLDRLIQVKRAAGRPKDLDAIAELEAIRDERRHVSDGR
jgi:predicted nucleotidyltransferase